MSQSRSVNRSCVKGSLIRYDVGSIDFAHSLGCIDMVSRDARCSHAISYQYNISQKQAHHFRGGLQSICGPFGPYFELF